MYRSFAAGIIKDCGRIISTAPQLEVSKSAVLAGTKSLRGGLHYDSGQSRLNCLSSEQFSSLNIGALTVFLAWPVHLAQPVIWSPMIACSVTVQW